MYPIIVASIVAIPSFPAKQKVSVLGALGLKLGKFHGEFSTYDVQYCGCCLPQGTYMNPTSKPSEKAIRVRKAFF